MALRHLSLRINQTFEELSVDLDVAALARRMGARPARLRALLEAAEIRDDQLESRATFPGHLRRPKRSTLQRITGALDLPDTVVDLWCREAPEAIAPEAQR